MLRSIDLLREGVYWIQIIFIGSMAGILLLWSEKIFHPSSPLPSSYPLVLEISPLYLSKDSFFPPLFADLLIEHGSIPDDPLPNIHAKIATSLRQPALPFYGTFVALSKGQSPNSVRLARSQVSPPISAIYVNGQLVCAHKKDKPHKSTKNKRGHIDLQCCLDPDEVPNPHCAY